MAAVVMMIVKAVMRRLRRDGNSNEADGKVVMIVL